MRKLIFLVAILIATFCAKAQINNVEIGGSIQCTHQFREKGFVNTGVDIRANMSVAPWSKLRANIGVNGFIPNGFDRYGYGTVGISAEAMPFYVFADFGLNLNPSSRNKIGMVFDTGVGLDFYISKRLALFTEVAIDRINNGKHWQSTAYVKAGAMYTL